MAYCTVSDVCSLFPHFVRQQAGSISDAQIQGWIDDASSRIHASFMQRGLDVDSLAHPLLSDATAAAPIHNQTNLLRDWCRAYGVWKLGESLQGSLSKNDLALCDTSRQWFLLSYTTIGKGGFDKEFFPSARTVDIFPGFVGTAGADTDTAEVSDPHWDGQNYAFRKNMLFLWPLGLILVHTGWRLLC